MSADGRYVAFSLDAGDVVPGDTNEWADVFVRDRVAGKTERVSVGGDGAQGNFPSIDAALSADGRYVAFRSYASNFVPGDTNGATDVFVRDRAAGTTERVSVGNAGEQGNGEVSLYAVPAVSADGRYVAFSSEATNLVPGDTNGEDDVFVRDRGVGAPSAPARAGKLTLRPNPPRAGRALTATMPITARGKPVASATVACAASIAGHTLRATSRTYRAGVARCVWTLPATSKGKTIRGSVRATTSNGPVARSFQARVT